MYATALPVNPLSARLDTENARFGVINLQRCLEEDEATPIQFKSSHARTISAP